MRRPPTTRVLVGLLALLAVLAACEDYLIGPGESADPEAPTLSGVDLTPDSVDIFADAAAVMASVRGRSGSGVDSVRVVLVSPSATERVRCWSREPIEGDAFEGTWSCPLDIAPGSESGTWVPDSIGIFSTDNPSGSRVWVASELQAAGVARSVRVVGIPPFPAALEVEPASVVLTSAEETVTLTATVRNQYGGAMPDIPVTWSSEDTEVATVTTEGAVTAVAVGATEIVVRADTLEVRVPVEVPSTPTVLDVEPELIAFDDPGAVEEFSVVVLNQFGDTLTAVDVTFESEDPEVATVDDSGMVTAQAVGSTVIRVRAGSVEVGIPVVVGGGQLAPGHRWTNPEGGSFTDPANWSRGSVPTASDTAIVDLTGDYDIRINATTAVAVLDVGNAEGTARPTFRLQDGRLAVEDTAYFAPGARLHIEYGILEGSGTVVVADTLLWSGGSQLGSGRTVVASGGALLMDGEEKIADERLIDLEGEGRWTAGKISLGNGGTLAARAGSELRLEAADTVAWRSGPFGRGFLRVEGRMEVVAPGGVTTITAGFVNEGEVYVDFGSTLETGGSGGTSGAGSWLIEADAVLEIGGNSATVQFGPGSDVRGAGTVRVVSSVLGVEGTLNMDGRIEVVGNSLSVSSPDTARVNQLHMLGGPVFVNSGSVLQVRDELVWETGAVISGGTLHLIEGANADLTAAGSRTVDTRAQFVVDGYAHWGDGEFLLRNGGHLLIRPTGVFEIDGAFPMGSANTLSPDFEPTFVNEGELLLSNSATWLSIQPRFTNRGVVTNSAFNLAFEADFLHEEGGIFRGGGTLDLTQATPVRLDGILSPGTYPGVSTGGPSAGVLRVAVDLPLEPTSRVDIELGGTTTGAHDVLEVPGLLDAAGELRVTGFDGYVPQEGHALTVLRFEQRSGAFDVVSGLDFGVGAGGVALDTVWMADRLMLVGQSGSTGSAPTVTIREPADGSIHPEGDPVAFEGSATDPEDGDLSLDLTWTSNVDGVLGSGAGVSSTLSPGPHSVTASVTDSDGQIGSDTISVTVSTATSGALYGVDAGTDALHRIDPVTGTSVRIGTNLGGPATPVAMAIVPSTEEVLVWSNSPSRELVSVDVCTGLATRVQSYLTNAGAIAYRADDRLFGFDDGEMFRIDMSTAGRPLTTVTSTLEVRLAGADFTPDNRLFGVELAIEPPVRMVEIDPETGSVLQSFDITGPSGEPLNPGVAGSMTWNPATGQFLASAIRGYDGVGTAFYDLSLQGVASNPRAQGGNGDQGMGFRSEPVCEP